MRRWKFLFDELVRMALPVDDSRRLVESILNIVGLRDSKNPAAGHIAVSAAAFTAFLDSVVR